MGGFSKTIDHRVTRAGSKKTIVMGEKRVQTMAYTKGELNGVPREKNV